MPKEPYRTEVFILGPGPGDYGSLGTVHDERRLKVEVEIKQEEHSSMFRGTLRYTLQAYTHYSNAAGRWGDPFQRWPEAGVIGQSIGLEEAQQLVRDLKAYQRYIDKLPIKPDSLDSHVAAMLKFHGCLTVKYGWAPDSHTKITWQDVSPQRACYLVKEKLAELNPDTEGVERHD